jgi:NAD(P)H-hydrate epimerase
MTVERIDDRTMAPLVPARPTDGHKGTFGTLIAVAGSLDYAGAALLAGTAALRAGCGIVVLAVPASLQPVLAGRVPELVTLGLPERVAYVADPDAAAATVAARRPHALLIGPGLPAVRATGELVAALLSREGAAPAGGPGPAAATTVVREAIPVVIDAGALSSLAERPGWWRSLRRPCVLTPHPGELARLDGMAVPADEDGRIERAVAASRRFGAIVVLKGARTVVAGPDGTAAIGGAPNPALATGGTGDILAGVIGSLLAQGMVPWDAARLGVHLHALAGATVAASLGDAGALASDLLPLLPVERARLTSVGR